MLDKIQRVKLSEEILFRLKEMIRSGKFGYGDKLPIEKRLAEIFGVSRTTVREALAVLEAEGWVTTKRGGGTYVKRIKGTERIEPLAVLLGGTNQVAILEVMELRKILEGEVGLIAASRAASKDIDAIKQAHEQMKEDVAAGKDTAASDYEFHYRVAKAAQNNTILTVLASLHELFYEVVRTNRWHWAKPHDYGQVLAEHHSIMKAIEKKQGRLAKKYIEEHLENAHRRIEEVLLRQTDDEEKI